MGTRNDIDSERKRMVGSKWHIVGRIVKIGTLDKITFEEDCFELAPVQFYLETVSVYLYCRIVLWLMLRTFFLGKRSAT